MMTAAAMAKATIKPAYFFTKSTARSEIVLLFTKGIRKFFAKRVNRAL